LPINHHCLSDDINKTHFGVFETNIEERHVRIDITLAKEILPAAVLDKA